MEAFSKVKTHKFIMYCTTFTKMQEIWILVLCSWNRGNQFSLTLIYKRMKMVLIYSIFISVAFINNIIWYKTKYYCCDNWKQIIDVCTKVWIIGLGKLYNKICDIMLCTGPGEQCQQQYLHSHIGYFTLNLSCF